MDKKINYRCSLCFTKVTVLGTNIGDKEQDLYEIYTGIKLPFCSGVHRNKYKQLIEDPKVYIKEYQKCAKKDCQKHVSSTSVNCLCGVAHKFCTTDCRDEFNKKIRRPLIPYSFSSGDLTKLKEDKKEDKLNKSLTSNLTTTNLNCTTCFCGDIDSNSKCTSGHDRCIMCEFRGRCRKCESKTWYQRSLYYFADLTWQQYENKVDAGYIPECHICKRQQIEVFGKGDEYYYIERSSRLYLIQPCNHIVCINCSHKIDQRECGGKHIGMSSIFFNEIGNTVLWSVNK